MPNLRVIPGGNAGGATTTAMRLITGAMDAEALRRSRQHIIRLEDELRVRGATDADLQQLRYGTTPPQATVTADAPPPCDRCGDDGVMRVPGTGEVLCCDHALADAEAMHRGDL